MPSPRSTSMCRRQCREILEKCTEIHAEIANKEKKRKLYDNLYQLIIEYQNCVYHGHLSKADDTLKRIEDLEKEIIETI